MEKPLQRIVSLMPSATENLFFLGLGKKIVGITEQCSLPKEAEVVERIGSFSSPDMDKIESLRPDLVVAHPRMHAKYVDGLKKRGVTVFFFAPKTVEDTFQKMQELCTLVGQVEPGYSLVQSLRARIDIVKKNVAKNKRPRVFRLMVEDPIYTVGPSSYQYDAILIAGGSPLTPNSEEAYTQVSLEEVIRFDPEAIISCGRSKDEVRNKRCLGCKRKNPACQRTIEEIQGWEGWKSINAVKEGRILTLPCQYICWPGHKLVDGIEMMASFFERAVNG